MNNPKLIDQLTQDLRPVCPCCPYGMMWRMIGLGVLGGAILLVALGLRPDLYEAWAQFMPWWKSGMFVLVGVGAALSLMRLGLPGRGVGLVGPTLITFGIAGLVAFALGTLAFSPAPMELIDNVLHKQKGICVLSLMTLGLALMAGGWLLLRRMAYTQPRVAGGLLGLASGAFAASAYAWHCSVDQPLYVAACYVGPVGLLALFGFYLGPRIFRL